MGQRKPRVGHHQPGRTRSQGLRPFAIARLGIGFAPEESEVFGDLTVAENILLPTWTRADRAARRPSARRWPIACFPGSSATARAAASSCRAASARWCRSPARLALDPKLLLLDEPTEGLSPAIVPSIVDGIASIRQMGHAVLIAESNLHHVPDFADRLYVIERGEIIYRRLARRCAQGPGRGQGSGRHGLKQRQPPNSWEAAQKSRTDRNERRLLVAATPRAVTMPAMAPAMTMAAPTPAHVLNQALICGGCPEAVEDACRWCRLRCSQGKTRTPTAATANGANQKRFMPFFSSQKSLHDVSQRHLRA